MDFKNRSRQYNIWLLGFIKGTFIKDDATKIITDWLM